MGRSRPIHFGPFPNPSGLAFAGLAAAWQAFGSTGYRGRRVPAFCWFSLRAPPPEFDLARSGWQRLCAHRLPETGPPRDCAILVDQSWIASGQRMAVAAATPAAKARVLVLGVQSSAERARLLSAGFGDAVPHGAELDEIEQRALRLIGAQREPLLRRAGPVILDLALRDGWAGERRLALHPLEFALLWRLAEAGGEAVSRRELLRDVWKIAFDPGTNRVEVHISRLRRKLLQAEVRGLIETAPQGGYRLAGPGQGMQKSTGPGDAIRQSPQQVPGDEVDEFPRPCRCDDRRPCRPCSAQPAGQDECARS